MSSERSCELGRRDFPMAIASNEVNGLDKRLLGRLRGRPSTNKYWEITLQCEGKTLQTIAGVGLEELMRFGR
jgi:hypothetical protein